MHNQHDWAVDDDQDCVKESVEEHSPGATSFSVDDAFSDTDDSDPNLEFSSNAIRADLARAASYSQESEELADAEESPDVGVTGDPRESPTGPCSSVCRMPVTPRASPLCRDILNPTPDTNQLYTKFDPISLSESPVRTSHVEDHDDVQNGLEVTNDGKGQQHTSNSSTSEAQHRATYSEESHPEPAAPDASQESPSPSPPPPELPSDTPSGDGSEAHPGQTAHERSTSTPSLPSSRPSAASSLPRPPSSGHKSSQSTGPSMLERVVSKTRPSFLPPKSKDEDNKHLADWEKMMKRSRAAGTLLFTSGESLLTSRFGRGETKKGITRS
jgi:hypothetical protein